MSSVGEYFTALIQGVLLLYVLIVIVQAILPDIPQFSDHIWTIVIAGAVALIVFARRGIR